MPGPFGGGYMLHDRAVAPYEEMRRNMQAAQALQPGVAVVVELVQKQIDYFGAAETTGWQADIVHDQQGGVLPCRAFVVIG